MARTLDLSSVLRSFSLGLAALALSATVWGCAPADTDGDEDDIASGEDAIGGECDRSPLNCKLPASKKDRNRIFNYDTNSYDWPIAAGTPLLDGLGNPRGLVKWSKVKINYGGRKLIAGKAHVYAFATALDTGITASGWVRESALAHGPISRMKTVKLKDPGKGDYEAVWTVTGGDPAAFGDLKVAPNFTGNNVAATDYLLRAGGVVNLLYNLPGSGGVSTDTYPAGVKFRRSKGVPELDVKLYNPGGSKVVGIMKFIYGHIGDRYGWIARDALVQDPPAPAPAPPTGQCYVRCCDETLWGPIYTAGAPACHDASQGVCAGHGYVKRSEFDQVEVYERPQACYAKCVNREKYHEVEGVTENCTEAATAYCAEGDRGGLEDAMWSQCQP